jgi:hypothetical protein
MGDKISKYLSNRTPFLLRIKPGIAKNKYIRFIMSFFYLAVSYGEKIIQCVGASYAC